MSGLSADLAYAARMLRKHPGGTILALLAIALAIGANSAMFSAVNFLLLRPLPYPHPDRLVSIRESRPRLGIEQGHTSTYEFLEWRRSARSFDALVAMGTTQFTVTGDGEPIQVFGARVTAGFFELLGVTPAYGRSFTEADEVSGANRVAILSYGLWQRRYGGNPAVVGAGILVDGVSHVIVGVLPRGLDLGSADFELLTPLVTRVDAGEAQNPLYIHYVECLGRLKPGESLEQALAELKTIASRIERDDPARFAGHSVWMSGLHAEMMRESKDGLLMLFGAVGLVLLIACSNVANLLLARASSRAREIAIRTALGAGRWRIVRQCLTESVLLGLLGGVLGLAFAWAGIRLLAWLSTRTPRVQHVSLDGTVLLFTFAVAVGSGVLFGLGPAIRISRMNTNETLRDGGRGLTHGSGGNRLRSLLVTIEVALALMLTSGASLLLASLWNLRQMKLGFSTERLLTLQLALNAETSMQRRRMFHDLLLERIRALPGVEGAVFNTVLPLGPSYSSAVVTVEGRPPASPQERPVVHLRCVSPDYFRTLGIPLRAGRDFTASDHAEAPFVAVVNETAARRLWPNEDPLGKRLKRGNENSTAPWLTVVGVVRDFHSTGLRRPMVEELYVPYAQLPLSALTLMARTKGEPAAIAPAVRNEIWNLNRNQPIHGVQTMETLIAHATTSERTNSILVGSFALLALILTAIGVYGVLSHMVEQRTSEIGIRMALGALEGDVMRQFLLQAVRLAAVGSLAGVLGAYVLRRGLETLLFGVKATDPWILSGVALFVIAVALTAAWVPAQRAVRVDPAIALRHE